MRNVYAKIRGSIKKEKKLLKQLLLYLINLLGFWGIYLLLYNCNINLGKILSDKKDLISDIITIIGVLITAISVYSASSDKSEQPESFSLKISAPLVIIASILTFILLVHDYKVKDAIVGLAILGLCGSSLRWLKATNWWCDGEEEKIGINLKADNTNKTVKKFNIFFIMAIIFFSIFYIMGICEFTNQNIPFPHLKFIVLAISIIFFLIHLISK